MCSQQHCSGPADRENSPNRSEGGASLCQEPRGHRLSCVLPGSAQPDSQHGQVKRTSFCITIVASALIYTQRGLKKDWSYIVSLPFKLCWMEQKLASPHSVAQYPSYKFVYIFCIETNSLPSLIDFSWILFCSVLSYCIYLWMFLLLSTTVMLQFLSGSISFLSVSIISQQ